MKQTFKDRLKILMGDDRPYTWSRKIGIEKGLFQYYWQKEKIPTFENLLKIQRHTGCSLDWLLTGKNVAFNKIENLPMVAEATPNSGARNIRLSKLFDKLKEIYSKKSDGVLDHLEFMVGTVATTRLQGR